MKKRIIWVDTAKAIGIFLVIFGHAYNCYSRWFIYGFHMPLFFFLSGLTINIDQPIKLFFAKRVKGLIIPYVVYGIFRLFWIVLFGTVTHNSTIPSIGSLIIGLFLCVRNTNYSVGLWFLPLLFVSEAIVYFIFRFTKKPIIQTVVSLALLIIGVIYARYFNAPIPWGMDAALVASFFLFVGVKSKEYIMERKTLWNNIIVTLVVYIIVFMLYVITFKNSGSEVLYPDMYYGRYGNVLLYLISAFVGITLVCNISKTGISDNGIIKYIGKNTIHIYCIHQILIDVLFWGFGKVFKDHIFNNHWYAFMLNLLIILIVLLMCLLYIKLLNRIHDDLMCRVKLINTKTEDRKGKVGL